MGTTELIFGARLREDTPTEVIDTLKYMIGELEEKPKIAIEIDKNVLCGANYFLGKNRSVCRLYYDKQRRTWALYSRAKANNEHIEQFLEWIKPYICSGSGTRDMYAVVIPDPTVYYLD